MTGSGRFTPVRKGRTTPRYVLPDLVRPTRRTFPTHHSATSAEVPTVGPSCPVKTAQPPPGRKDAIDPDQLDAGVQWSQGAEIPTSIRPSGASTMLLTSPTPAGRVTTVRWSANEVPSSPLYASTRPVEVTYMVSPDQSR